jgi:hypothetical protein
MHVKFQARITCVNILEQIAEFEHKKERMNQALEREKGVCSCLQILQLIALELNSGCICALSHTHTHTYTDGEIAREMIGSRERAIYIIYRERDSLDIIYFQPLF